MKLLFGRFLRFIRPSSHTRVARLCREVIDRCREAKRDVKDVLEELARGHSEIKGKLADLKAPSGFAAEHEILMMEFKFQRLSLETVASGYAAAIKHIESDATLCACLAKLAEVRDKLTQQESAYYDAMRQVTANFSACFLAACDLRTAASLCEQVSRDVCDRLHEALVRSTLLATRPVFELTGQKPVPAETLQLPRVAPLEIPTVADLVADLAKSFTLRYSEAGVFAQATRDVPVAAGNRAATNGVVMRDVVNSEDSIAVSKGEVLQLLSEVHGFALVRRCSNDRTLSNVGLMPLSAVRRYAVSQAAKTPDSQPNQTQTRGNTQTQVRVRA